MRKLLINSTALATVAAITAGAAFADGPTITASTEFKYIDRSSLVTATDGTEYVADSEIKMVFTNKTDSGLTVAYTVELESDGDGTATMDESSFSVAGGFGTFILGHNDGVGNNFSLVASDIIAEEERDSVASARISTSTDLAAMSGDAMKVSYLLPAMGGLTAGVSHADGGITGNSDTTSLGARYAMDLGGASITLAAASATTANATQDKETTSMGVQLVSGDFTVVLSRGSFEENDEDQSSSGAAISYAMGNGITLGAFSMSSDDSLDVGEEYKASGIEAQYTIAAGLTAVIGLTDYDYQVSTSQDSDMSTVSDSGTTTALTIKASF
jgi:hypothetical protein